MHVGDKAVNLLHWCRGGDASTANNVRYYFSKGKCPRTSRLLGSRPWPLHAGVPRWWAAAAAADEAFARQGVGAQPGLARALAAAEAEDGASEPDGAGDELGSWLGPGFDESGSEGGQGWQSEGGSSQEGW